MKRMIIATFSLLALVLGFSFAGNVLASGADNIPSTTKKVVVKQRLEVLAIDHEKRTVQLKDASGFTQTITVGEGARNFSQLAVGDIVDVNRSKSIKIKAFGADSVNAGAEAAAVFARTPEGQKPGAAIVGSEVVVVTIAAIDLENSLVTLKDKEGNTSVLSPEIPSNLKKVKVGDKVAIMLTQTLSITVEKK